MEARTFPASGICSSAQVVSLKTSVKVALLRQLRRPAADADRVVVAAAAAKDANTTAMESNLDDLEVDRTQPFCHILFVGNQIIQVRNSAHLVVKRESKFVLTGNNC